MTVNHEKSRGNLIQSDKRNAILTEKQCETLITDIFIPKNKFTESTLAHLLNNKDMPDYTVDT